MKIYVIGLDKNGYQVNIFLIFPQKHFVYSFIEVPQPARDTSVNEYTQHIVFVEKYEKSINTCRLKKASYQELSYVVGIH